MPSPVPPPAPPRPTSKRPLLLRAPHFTALLLAQAMAQGAIRMFQVGTTWWLISHTASGSSGLTSGLFITVSTLPGVVLAPWIARIVATRHTGRVMRTAAAAAAVTSAILAVWAHSGPLPLAAAYAGAWLLSSSRSVLDTCVTTALSGLVADRDLEEATGFVQATQPLAALTGAMLGAMVTDRVGMTGLTLFCAVAYVTAAGLLIPSTSSTAANHPAVPRERRLRPALARNPHARRLLWCFALFNLVTVAAFLIIPLYTHRVLHTGGATVAWLEGALGIGLLTGSLTGSRLPGRPATLTAACLALCAAALAVPGLAPHQQTAIPCMAVAGWCGGVIDVRIVAQFQRHVADLDKAAFFAVMQAVLGAVFPIGALVFGALADHLSASTLFLVQGAALLPIAAAVHLLGRARPPHRRSPTDTDKTS
ncbi:MFS transporter [Streptomyces sp. IBSNAI002]|uniref:MFS transporter n=1 Tax=Streptomyces sp. IBSNAI002 TaxID=3457500 RepID=UPI003FCFBA1D